MNNAPAVVFSKRFVSFSKGVAMSQSRLLPLDDKSAISVTVGYVQPFTSTSLDFCCPDEPLARLHPADNGRRSRVLDLLR